MQIHWENLAALCGFDTPGRKQAAALAVSYGLAFFRRARMLAAGAMQDAPLSYPELSLPDIGGLPAAGTLVLTVNNRLARRLTLELAGLLRAERQVSELPRIVPCPPGWLSRPMSWRSTRAATCPHIGWTASPRRWCGPRRSAPRGRARAAGRARRRGWPWTPTCSWTSGSCACHRARTPMNTGLCPLAPALPRGPGRAGRRGCEPGLCARAGRAGPAGWQRRSGWCWPASPRSRRASRACWTRSRPRARTSASGATRSARPRSRVASRPRIRAASGAPPRAGPRRNCRPIRQVATPSSRRSWKPNPCSPGACWARRWPATARPAGVQRGRGPATG